MFGFYEDFYARVAHSSVHAEFCERVFGRNLCQHGFADMEQIHKLIEVLQLSSGQRVLDVGCGNGMIAEYIADTTGAHVTGLDNIPQAVDEALERTLPKADRLSFAVGDINALSLPDHEYDAIVSIDSIYFSDDYARTIRQWVDALKPGGRIGILYAHGREPWVPKDQFHVETLAPDHTPLAEALHANRLSYRTWDFTDDDYRLALLRKQVLAELRPRFEAEDLMFIYDNRMGDAHGVSQAVEEGMHARYLYEVQAPG
ncbi:MAG: class I SAM-dependent methyltransferase [Anaerolineae bacterium]|nr:class I SAM-dependent methyltransferase [Anaerolineae bacterium]